MHVQFSVRHICQEEGGFIVRQATSLDDLQWIIRKSSEGGVRSAKEADCYFTAGLTRDFYIGELNGRRISSVALVWHGESHAFGGCFFVNKLFRGQGYGEKTYRAVFTDDITNKHRLQGYAVLDVQDFYVNNGFRASWLLRHYQLTVPVVRERLAGCFLLSVAKILPAKEANFEELRAYGADMMGSSQTCDSMLAAMLVHAQESSWVAIGNRGEIVGYLIMNKATQFPEDGYLVGPFFADSASVARILLQTAAEFAAQDGSNSSSLSLDASISNLECVHILENELEAKPVTDAVCIGNKGILYKAHEKIYSLANVSIM